MRVGSSMKDRLWSTRITPRSRSARPPQGGTSPPQAPPLPLHERGPDLPVRHAPSAERLRERTAERDPLPLDRDVEVEALLAEEDVPDGAAHEVDAVERLADGLDRLEHALEAGEGE